LPRALNLLRPEPEFRHDVFTEGLQAAGFDVVERIADPKPQDVCLIWNRGRANDDQARRFSRVLVAENAYVRLKGWYALARDHHNGVGHWSVGGPERWASLGVELQPWRTGREIVILGQRGIGERGVASGRGWEDEARRRVGGRIRPHPGRDKDRAIPLEQDLKEAACVVTWGSAAAFQALIMGVPVFYGLKGWIGSRAGRHVENFSLGPVRDDAARLAMFERLAWAQSHVDEIRTGEAIRRLL
jgi:hypothetical protein